MKTKTPGLNASSLMRTHTLAIAIGLAVFTQISPPAHATYMATLEQVGSNVVGTGSGSLDITNLTLIASGTVPSVIDGSAGILLLGHTTSVSSNLYHFISGPAGFGSGFFRFADSGAGNIVGIIGGESLNVPGGLRLGHSFGDEHRHLCQLGRYSWNLHMDLGQRGTHG